LQNLFLASASIVCLAMPALLGFIPLWMAVALHEGTTLLVALNCLRLALKYRNGGYVPLPPKMFHAALLLPLRLRVISLQLGIQMIEDGLLSAALRDSM
jgi:hypothetical protein